ncbi:TM0106 family RecB-like putative nuclease [Nocardioides cynanchi]|uniref:TM0106 family RecB-like putative nuclease n=1 Tax=Nocardioides cynanchi TaxID=2558918 RepID=UPI001244D370|nr:TM0106 family RecB-like putative nuclease [Nocardioides cynanchi]
MIDELGEPTRVDVLLGAYPARQCVYRTKNKFDPRVPPPAREPDDVLLRMEEGRAFEQAMVLLLTEALGDRCLSIMYGDHRADKERRIAETVAAMEAGVPVIIGGQLPDDLDGGRTGSPDVLFRATRDEKVLAQYWPADIKHHSTLKKAERSSALLSWPGGSFGGGVFRYKEGGWSAKTPHRAADCLQLAHYTRMLQAMGRHPGEDQSWGAILGTSDFTAIHRERHGWVWYDLRELTETTWSGTSPTGKRKRSIMESYDHEFADRLRVARAAISGGPSLVQAFGKAECHSCPYLPHCRAEAGPEDASFAILKGQLSDREWRYLYSQGLGTIDALADARLSGDLLTGYLAQSGHLPNPTARLDAAIHRARMLRDGVLLERTSSGALAVPTADVEIDFDVEWHPADGHVYQWGARVRRGQDESTSTYEHAVVSFEILDDASAQALADEFFTWLEAFVAEHEANGNTVGIFHWTSPEITKTIRVLGGQRAHDLFEDRFLDLKRWMEQHFFARDGFGLKVVAPIFGFKWGVDDASGLASVKRIDEARATTEPEVAAAAREWLLAYNEDDCAAQAAIRDGLRAFGDARELREEDVGRGTSLPVSEHDQGAVPSAPTPVSGPRQDADDTIQVQPSRGGAMPSASASRRLALNEIRRRVAQFVIDYSGVTSEQRNTTDFWKAFMACYGVGDSYLHGVTFEYPARRSDTGREGRIDVFLPGQYLIEQKSQGQIRTPRLGSESNAETQAKAYLTGGTITEAQMPRWLVTSDFATIQVTDLSLPARSVNRTRTVAFADLNAHVEMFLFLAGEDPDALIAEEQAEASVQAARLMGDLYAALTGDADIDADEVPDREDEDAATMEASVLLTRLLFLMFGDDAGLWQRGLFQRFIETRTSIDGSDLGQQLRALFEVLDMPDPRSARIDEAMRAFPYVNGELYRNAGHDQTIWFDTDMRAALLAACRFDWSRISPAVFGSLFQTVKSRAARHLAGEHYTSEWNILKILRPMFLDEYSRRLDQAHTKPQLEALHHEFKRLRFVDPACGCGNFLIVAYREMRRLELDLLVKLKALQGRSADLVLDPSEMLNVRLDQFYGIELNWWPAKIAETAMYLVDHQANQQMLNTLGLPVVRLPINIRANIHHGNALTTNWHGVLPAEPDVRVFVFGNPPFLGRKTTNQAQKLELATAWGMANTGHLDFVTAWHAKALAYLHGRNGEFGFVTTNSVTQGEPVSDLFPRIEAQGWRIKFAHRTFAWRTESAARDTASVHCVIVGFTRDSHAKPRLFDYPTLVANPEEVRVTTGINGYLLDAPNVYVTGRSAPLSSELPRVSYGSMPRDGGNLLVSAEQYSEFAADPVASKYLRRFVGADELIQNKQRWCLWMADDFDPADVNRSPLLRARLTAVRAMREQSKADSTRAWAASPHLFVQQAQPKVAFLAIPAHVSEFRRFFPSDRLGADVICGNANFTCPDPDGFAFAIISSSMFITWQKTVGGRIKSDLRFSKDVVWNNLPLPPVGAALRREIIAAGERVQKARLLHSNRSLADHYQPLAMAPELLAAHRALDRVVDKAFGVRRARTLSVGDRQQILFDSYVELTAGDGPLPSD